MSADPRTPGGLEHDVEVEAALRTCGSPAARAEFCDELRRRFLDVPATRASSRRRFGPPLVGLLAAAAVVAAGYFLLRPSPSEWRVLEVAPGSVVKADGVVLPAQEPAVLARALRKAGEIEVERGDLVLQIGDLSLFDLGEGTRVAFAGFDPDESSSPLTVRAASGRVRARTGPGFAGRTMNVRTDSLAVVVTGTAFAVDYESAGTCVCCLHGTVQIQAQAVGPGAVAIQAGKMCLVFHEVRAPLWGDSPEAHVEPLERLEARAVEIWR